MKLFAHWRWLLTSLPILILASLVGPLVAEGRPPEIRNLSLRGLQIGGATVITLDGADLLPAPRLFLADQILDCAVDPQSTANRVILSVPIPETFAPGIVSLRLATAEGISNGQFIGIDRFPQLPLTETIQTLPAAVHGSVPGSGVSRTSFNGKSGDVYIFEVEARRLGSKLRPTLHIYDSRRIQIGWASPTNSLWGDCRVTVKLPRDDQYAVEIHDAQYAPPGASFFRLKIGNWHYADLAFPPSVPRGQDSSVILIGNVEAQRVPLNLKDAEATAVPWRTPQSAGLVPTVTGSSIPEVVRLADEAFLLLPAVPVAVSGQLLKPGQRDRYQLPIQPGTKLLMEIFADRIGSRLDGVLEVRNKQNALIASNDDGPNTTDPRLEITAPPDQDILELTVRDQLETGSEASIYRLVVTAIDHPIRQFDVTLKSDTINVPMGESQVVEAFANRQAFDDPIQILMAGLPTGLQVEGAEIPAGSNGTLISIMNPLESTSAAVTRFKAQSTDGSIVRTVRIESSSDDRLPVWLRDQIAISTTPRQALFQIAVTNEASPAVLTLASKPAYTLKLIRPHATFGPIRLSLVTSQPVPKVNGQPNLNAAIRAEKAVEIPVDNAVKAAGDNQTTLAKQHAEAFKQAQAAQADAKVAAEGKLAELAEKLKAAEAALIEAESKAVYQAEYSLLVPSSLQESSCAISIRAELLNVERNSVLRTTYTPVRRLTVLNPLTIVLTTSGPVEAAYDPKTGATVAIGGRIERLGDYKGDVTVTMSGLPAGVSAANVAVKSDQSEFKIEIKFPANFAAAEIPGLKLTATGPPDPQSGNVPVKSAEVSAAIKLNQ